MSRGNVCDAPQLHPSFRKKPVYCLDCCFCGSTVCRRGMKAILLADTKTELFSTDVPDRSEVDVTCELFYTDNCQCEVEHMACKECGNIVGYHVRMPCRDCLQSCNNGHLWMYHRKVVMPRERLDRKGEKIMVWGKLPDVSKDFTYQPLEECIRRLLGVAAIEGVELSLHMSHQLDDQRMLKEG
ncbi:hypothetical protein ScPMuIL_008938 [Solemya velum]